MISLRPPPEGAPSERVTVEVALEAQAARAALLKEARAGLVANPRELSPRWLYDERGSLLFEEITRLPEYYPTRREREILGRHAGDIARLTRAQTLLELGSGSSEKTNLLLDALTSVGTLERFVPFDVAEAMLTTSAHAIARVRPGLSVHAVVGDFEQHLGRLPSGGRRLLVFLGGTIGNLEPQARARFLQEVRQGLGPEDTFLLGTDLLKDRARLHAAYNDAAGVTAAFNLNVLSVLNREVGADFDLAAYAHRAFFDEEHRWIEMRLRSLRAQVVTLSALELQVSFAPGDELRTEVSCKFSPEQVDAELSAAGLHPLARWTDRAGDFALTLARRR